MGQDAVARSLAALGAGRQPSAEERGQAVIDEFRGHPNSNAGYNALVNSYRAIGVDLDKERREQRTASELDDWHARVANSEENWNSWLARHVNTFLPMKNDAAYERAMIRARDGNLEPGDAELIATQDRLRELDAHASTGSRIAGEVAGIPMLVLQNAVGGAALRGAGMGLSALGARGAGAVLAGGAVGGARTGLLGLAGRAGGVAVRQSLSAPLIPSLYGQSVIQNNVANHRDPLDLAGLPAALGMAAIQNTILGSLSQYGQGMGTGALGFVGRGVFRTGAGIAEQQVADILTSASGLSSGYGVIGDFIDGRSGDAMQHLAVQAATFAAFHGLHEAQHENAKSTAPPVLIAFNDALGHLSRSGLSKDAAARALAPAFDAFSDAMHRDANLTSEQAQTVADKLPEGPVRDMAKALADAMPEKSGTLKTPEEALGPPKASPQAEPGQTSTPGVNAITGHSGTLEAIHSVFPESRETASGALRATIGDRTLDMRVDPSSGAVRLDFGWSASEKAGVSENLQRGSLGVFREMRKLADKLKQSGAAIEYTANDAHAGAYERMLNKAGYEQVGGPVGKRGSLDVRTWRPAAEKSTEWQAKYQELRNRGISDANARGMADLLHPAQAPEAAKTRERVNEAETAHREALVAESDALKSLQRAKSFGFSAEGLAKANKTYQDAVARRLEARDNLRKAGEVAAHADITARKVETGNRSPQWQATYKAEIAKGNSENGAARVANLHYPEQRANPEARAMMSAALGEMSRRQAAPEMVDHVTGHFRGLLQADPTTAHEYADLMREAYGNGKVGELTKAKDSPEFERWVRNVSSEYAKRWGLSEASVRRDLQRTVQEGLTVSQTVTQDQGANRGLRSGPVAGAAQVHRGESETGGIAGPRAPAVRGAAGGNVVEPPAGGAPPTEAERRGGSIGGGQPDAGTIERPRRVTALANQVTDAERARNNMAPREAPGGPSNQERWDAARQRLNEDPMAAVRLVDDLAKNPRPPTADENAMLLVRKIALENEHARAMLQVIADGKPGQQADAITMRANEAREEALYGELKKLYDVIAKTGTEAGTAFQFRAQLATEDFSLGGMLRNAEGAKGEPLTKEERQQIIEQQQKIADLQKQLDEAQKVVQNTGGAKSPEFDRAQKVGVDIKEEQNKFKRQINTWRDAKRTFGQKFEDWLVKLRRAFVISSPKTMIKIIAASAERMVFSPMEQAAGAIWARIPGISKIAAMAPREGRGFNRETEVKAMYDGFSKGLQDSLQTLKTGHSELDVLYGSTDMPRSWLDFVGELHAAGKAPAVRAEYTRSFLERLDHGIARGQDVTSPTALMRIGLEAYKDSQAAKFQQDNRVVDAWKRAVSTLKAKDAGAASRAIGTGMQLMVPVVRIPTNLVAEAFNYAFGSVTGLTRAGMALSRGIEGMKPAEADLIMRSLKKGSLGLAAMTLGFLNPNIFGGYYSGKRKESDVPTGGIRTGLGTVPSWLLHNPLLEVLQLGATVRRSLEGVRRGQSTNTINAVGAGILGLTEEVPFMRQTVEMSHAFIPSRRGRYFGELLKSFTVPQAIQWLAGETDKDSRGEPIQRHPHNVGQYISEGIPGLRQTVPLR